jgi:hypothetical protein
MADLLNNLAIVYDDQGKYGEVEALYHRALEIRGECDVLLWKASQRSLSAVSLSRSCPADAREEAMSEQHAVLLKKARERLVEDRRAFAKIIAAPFEREKTRDARERFIDIQAAIEAVDRAIEDEDCQVATAMAFPL